MRTKDRVLIAIADMQRSTGFTPLSKEVAGQVGVCCGVVSRALGQLVDDGRLTRRGCRIKLTEQGWRSAQELRA